MIYTTMEDWGSVQTDWAKLEPEDKKELRLTGLAAYQMTEETTPLRDIETIVAYVHPETDIELPEGERNTLNLISTGDRPDAARYQDEFGDKVGVVSPDTYYSDLMDGNERYFRRQLIESEEFRQNVIQTISDKFYTEIVDQYSPLFDSLEDLERF